MLTNGSRSAALDGAFFSVLAGAAVPCAAVPCAASLATALCALCAFFFACVVFFLPINLYKIVYLYINLK